MNHSASFVFWDYSEKVAVKAKPSRTVSLLNYAAFEKISAAHRLER